VEKYIGGIKELNLGKKINCGSCGDIYLYSPEIYFKRFNEDYRDLTDKINLEFFDTIKTLSEISDVPSIIKAIDIYRSVLELYGYTMPRIDADTLEDITDDTLVVDLANSFERLKPEIRILSNNNVKTEDIGGDNLLYNGHLYLIDLDLSLIDKRYIPDELYVKTSYNIFIALLSRMVGKIYDNDGMKYFRSNLNLGNSDEYMIYFKKLVEYCSDSLGEEVKTLGDLKRTYQKTYRPY